MRKWQSHKVVEADIILGMRMDGPPMVKVKYGEHYEEIIVPSNFFSRGSPRIGDYFVRYEDGYVSWSPAKAFEEGYMEIK